MYKDSIEKSYISEERNSLAANPYHGADNKDDTAMTKFLLWLLLLILCWPIAILALILYPVVWLLMLPFRLIGITVDALFSFIKALFLLPSRILGSR